MARRPTPTKILKMRGTNRSDRRNGNEPQPEVDRPEPPDVKIELLQVQLATSSQVFNPQSLLLHFTLR